MVLGITLKSVRSNREFIELKWHTRLFSDSSLQSEGGWAQVTEVAAASSSTAGNIEATAMVKCVTILT